MTRLSRLSSQNRDEEIRSLVDTLIRESRSMKDLKLLTEEILAQEEILKQGIDARACATMPPRSLRGIRRAGASTSDRSSGRADGDENLSHELAEAMGAGPVLASRPFLLPDRGGLPGYRIARLGRNPPGAKSFRPGAPCDSTPRQWWRQAQQVSGEILLDPGTLSGNVVAGPNDVVIDMPAKMIRNGRELNEEVDVPQVVPKEVLNSQPTAG